MGDKKFVELKPRKMGMEYLGTISPKRQSLLLHALEIVKADMGKSWASRLAAKEIFWLNIWQDEDDVEDDNDIMRISDSTVAEALDAWCRRAVRKYCGRKAIIDGYGFAINPIGSNYQPWHIDYATDVANVYIPLTPFTDKNAMQYLAIPEDTPKCVLELVAADTDNVDVAAVMNAVDFVVIQQMVAKPMSVLYMRRGTIHRGIPNTGEDDRIVFYMSVHFIKDYEKNYPYDSESLQTSESVVGTLNE